MQPKSNHPPSHDQRLSSIKNRKIAISRHESANSGYRLGGTLGDSRKHWFRDKFGNGRFRLFFRYDLRAKIIVYVWVNDETTLRTYGAKSDAYAVFTSMLNDGNPPDGWDRLLAACKDPEALKRAENMLKKADED